jgi:hypothetical protein
VLPSPDRRSLNTPADRERLLGCKELLSALPGALARFGADWLDAIKGVAALAIGATVIVVAPILVMWSAAASPQLA